MNNSEKQVSIERLGELREIVDSVLDPAVELAGTSNEDWDRLVVSWSTGRAKVTLTSLGRSGICMVLDSETYSSNGVHSKTLFEVSVQPNEGEAHEAWESDWSHPVPGSSFGSRGGDEVIGQLEAELDRFIPPINADNASVTSS